jgi:UDP-N-acetylmuramoyl-tripeptide--D-alanyl-D-alanine ligase
VPLSLSFLEPSTDYGIFEIGSSSCGEINELSKYLSPDIGIITNIYEAHIGKYKNISELSQEKMSIIDNINKVLIFDGDSKYRDEIETKGLLKNLKMFSVGFSDNCDFQVIELEDNIKLKTPSRIFDYHISANGKHFAYVSGFVIATLYALDLKIDDFFEYFQNLSPIGGRGNIETFEFQGKNFKVVDDSYNSSPSSLLASIECLHNIKGSHKILVMGQMKELGKEESHYHRMVFEKINTYNFDNIIFVGDETLWDVAHNELKEVLCFQKIDDFVIEKILKIIQNDSVVLLKGSRSIELNKFIDYIKCSTP